jgi:hypothetical protein
MQGLTDALSKVVVSLPAPRQPAARRGCPALAAAPHPYGRPAAPAAQLSTTKAVHQRGRSAESVGTPDHVSVSAAEDEAAPRTEVEDCYGFLVSVTAAQADARARCAERQQHQRAKWEADAPDRVLPQEERLKRLCRKVSSSLTGAWRGGCPLPGRVGAWAARSMDGHVCMSWQRGLLVRLAPYARRLPFVARPC